MYENKKDKMHESQKKKLFIFLQLANQFQAKWSREYAAKLRIALKVPIFAHFSSN